MYTELLKYAPVKIKVRYVNIIPIYWNIHKIPHEWIRGKICLIFIEGNSGIIIITEELVF
jgi:hypothetical protein